VAKLGEVKDLILFFANSPPIEDAPGLDFETWESTNTGYPELHYPQICVPHP